MVQGLKSRIQAPLCLELRDEPFRVCRYKDEMRPGIASFAEFWPLYVGEHRRPGCRVMHYLGAGAAIAFLLGTLLIGNPWLLLGIPLAGYGLAWCGHFQIERNSPATFLYVRWSIYGEFKMFWYFLSGRMGREVERLYGSRSPAPDAPLISPR